MINIFGLRIVTGKDWDALQKQVRTIKTGQGRLDEEIEWVHKRLHRTNNHVAGFMDFVMRRMPLKRHRKEAREYFPPATNMK